MSCKAKYQSIGNLLPEWTKNLASGNAPLLYPIGRGSLENIEVGPHRVILLGGAPGFGKTAFTMQAAIDAVRLTPKLKVVVCNVEMPAGVLLERQLARMSGIDLTTIRYRRMKSEHQSRLDAALKTLESIADRLCFVRPPFTLENVAETADEFGADLILLDYIQRIPPPGVHCDQRNAVNATMSYIRQFADHGKAVMIVSAVGRTKDARGRASYDGDGLNLASFRESSELEYGADDAYILVGGRNSDVVLKHLKSRNGEQKDLELEFNRPLQRFTAGVTAPDQAPAESFSKELTAAWDSVAAAEEDLTEEAA